MFQAIARITIAVALTVTTTSVAAQQQSAPSGARTYAINAGDEIEVYVWGEERLQRQLRILPDGSFSFPLVGRVMAQGRTPDQIAAEISKGLEGQYRGQVPQVTVSVRAPTGLQFSVVGKVRAPGSFTPGRYINVLEALSMAGGTTEFANLDNVAIVRKTGRGSTVIRANLGGAMKGNIGSGPNAIPDIESGDTVIVP
ncbi:MAG TPA: polysaccharide biosynthesis/export family protein [Sphingobium sp.]|nr:polysaccharide biosynthesis/export family protein [Sphingobium sp.]